MVIFQIHKYIELSTNTSTPSLHQACSVSLGVTVRYAVWSGESNGGLGRLSGPAVTESGNVSKSFSVVLSRNASRYIVTCTSVIHRGDSTCKKLHLFIKGKKCDSSGIAPLKEDGVLHGDQKRKAELLNKQFSSVFTTEGHSDIPDMGQNNTPDAPDITVQKRGIQKLLKGLSPHKATGPDEMSTKLLKDDQPSITCIYSHLLSVVESGTYTKGLEVCKRWSNLQNGGKSKPSNYRPVSLTSVYCKSLNMSYTATWWSSSYTTVASVETPCSESKVPWLTGPRKSSWKDNHQHQWYPVYPGDCPCATPIKSNKNSEIWQQDLDDLQKWESDWLIHFNPDKCKVSRITNRNERTPYMTSPWAVQTKYLGITFSNNLSWNDHIDKATKKANNTPAFSSRNLSSYPQTIKKKKYTTLVRPQEEYSATGPSHLGEHQQTGGSITPGSQICQK